MTPTVLLDCRWLSLGGAGRLTELLLRGLAQHPPAGRWVLWGPPATRELAWPGAEVAHTTLDPRAGFGQRGWFQLPRSDLAVFLHQQRPLRRVRSVTVILDTIPLRFAASRLDRAVKRLFLRRVVTISGEVATISRYSQACIGRDLRTPAERVAVLSLPADDALAERVHALRERLPRQDAALYVGAFLPHKNLPRLVEAFARTDFRAGGGQLWLVGGAPEHRRHLEQALTPDQRRFVLLRERCDQQELERLLATAAFLVQPSLEEGFGLPVLEALSCGLPVCVSDGGALPEITAGVADPFPARSVGAMAASIDATARRATDTARPAPAPWAAPSTADFARQFEEIVWRNLR